MPSSSLESDTNADTSREFDTEPNRLPSYEEAVDALDSTRLPGYRRMASARFHPYRRPTLKVVNKIDRLFNTIFDEEYVPLEVPQPRHSSIPWSPSELDFEIYLRCARAIEFELRVERLNTVIGDFIEGVRRAHVDE